MPPDDFDPFDDLLSTLDLTAEENDVFRGHSQMQPHGRVYGGQVIAQGVIAAGRTLEDVDERFLHSLHGYFLRPGDLHEPIRFEVERLRDGRSFSARRVHALQFGRPILAMTMSFQTPSEGLDHQSVMPAVPDPDTLPSAVESLSALKNPVSDYLAATRPIDLRHSQGHLYAVPRRQRSNEQSVWIRAAGTVPSDDHLVHAAILAYASDYTLLESVLREHGLAWADRRLRAASLDHAMWFHRPFRADEWILYAQESPSAQGGRGLGLGRMFDESGTLVATVAQEGMLRLKQ
ncbi:MAG: acyl-CoA thioesterase II [Mobilicoccus sp.]|nr:acyl-CoA thioesterase II [Mobilicoccus sp.]